MNVINESHLIKLWKHIKDPNRSFGVVSAYKKDLKEKENLQRHLDLGKEIKKQDYFFIEYKAGYSYIDCNDYYKESHIAEEQSYFIPNINVKSLLYLGLLFQQEAVIHKDSNKFALYYCDSNEKDQTFKELKRVFSLFPYDIEKAYSQLIKVNSNRDIKLAYFAELRFPSWIEANTKRPNHELPRTYWITIMEY